MNPLTEITKDSKMDDETAAIVLQLQLEEINDLLRDSSLEGERPITTNARTALELYQNDLRDRANLFNDRRMARSIGRAVQTDRSMIAANRLIEINCERDHSLALRENGQAQPTPRATATPSAPNNEEISENLASFNRVRRIHPGSVFPIPHGLGEKTDADTPRTSHATEDNRPPNALPDTLQGNILPHATTAISRVRPHADIVPQQLNKSEAVQRHLPFGSDSLDFSNEIYAHPRPEEQATENQIIDAQPSCAGCEGQHPQAEMLQASCKHSYCHSCIAQYVEVALLPDSIFPPSCCEFPLTANIMQGHISPELLDRDNYKQEKISSMFSVTCATKWCKATIPPNHIEGSKAQCPNCIQDTCRNCKMTWHEGETCDEGKDRGKLAKLAESEGWQICYACGELISISSGCN